MNKNILIKNSITILTFAFLSFVFTNLSAATKTKPTKAITEPTKATTEPTRFLGSISDILANPATLEPFIPHVVKSGVTLRVFTIVLEYLVNARSSMTQPSITSLETVMNLTLLDPTIQGATGDDYVITKEKITALLQTIS